MYLESFGFGYLGDGWVDLGDRLDSSCVSGHPGLACTDMEVGQEARRRRASVRYIPSAFKNGNLLANGGGRKVRCNCFCWALSLSRSVRSLLLGDSRFLRMCER